MAEKEQSLLNIYVGTYADSQQPGIYQLTFNLKTQKLNIVDSISGIINPSYLTIDPENYLLFAVSETSEGSVVSYKIEKSTYQLKELNRQKTNGADPCYVSLDSARGLLYFVNYSGGSFGVFPYENYGTIGGLVDHIQLTGQSINKERQESPHPHTIVISPNDTTQFIADLGTDKIYQYDIDLSNNKLVFKNEVNTEPGTGPRHIAFNHSLSIIYVVQELDSSIAAYQIESNGTLKHLQTISMLPPDFSGTNIAADIHISTCGKHLYGSNRGHDSIVTYHIQEDRKLKLGDYTSTSGKTPRNFLILPDGSHMLVANQDSNSIAIMKMGENGVPKIVDILDGIPQPVCLKVFA